MIGYRLLRLLIRTAAAVFFRQIEVVGLEHVPEAGPVIFVGNHPNALMDPILLIVSTRRVVRFASKDTLFEIPLLRLALKLMGAVPVARRSDHPEGPLDNRTSFDELFRVLSSGGAMGIFPEGVSHDASQLQRMKTGTARIALGVAAAPGGLRVQIVPCGLTYVHRHRFRSRVLVQFGAPIEAGPERVEDARGDEREAVKHLTADIERALRDLTVNAPDWDTVRVLDGVRRLYQPPNIRLEDRVELARRFNRVYPQVKGDPEVIELYGRVVRYLDRLREAGLSDRDLRRQISPSEALGKIGRHLLLLLVWLPLAVPGFVLHAPVGLLAVYAARVPGAAKDMGATTKLVSGVVGCLIVYAALLGAVLFRFGWPWTFVTAAALPLTGYANLVVLDRGASVRRHASTLARLLSLGRELETLRRERAALEIAVIGAVDRLRPKDMESLFAREGSEERRPGVPAQRQPEERSDEGSQG